MATHKDLQRINRAVTYVEDHLDESITVASMAHYLNLSEFHFHRIFKSVTNEPFNQFVQRKRLEHALFELKAPSFISIQRVAFNSGFSSQANFSKAFKSYFGFSPSEYRKSGARQNSKDGKLSSKMGKVTFSNQVYDGTLTDQDRQLVSEQCQQIGIIDVEQSYYCYVASTTGYTFSGIEQAWEQLKELLVMNDIPLYQSNRSVAFCRDNHWLTPLEQCRYEAGYRVDNPSVLVENGVAIRTIEAGRYLSAEYKGKISEVRHPFCLWLASEWIPENKILLASKMIIERYHQVDMVNDYIHHEILIRVY